MLEGYNNYYGGYEAGQNSRINYAPQQNQSANNQNQAQSFQNNMNGMNTQQMRYVIPGKPIRSEQEINIQDIPTDGSAGVFPFVDGSGVITKAWNNKGTIDTKLYLLQEDMSPKTAEAGTVDLTPIMERLDRIENKLKYRGKPYKNNRNGGDNHGNTASN